MLKKTVTYEDFNGDEVTEDLFFHLSKAELIELELSQKDGFSETLKKVIEAEDGQSIIREFKKIVMTAYGKRSPDGKRFIKTQELRDDFESSEAYSTLFMSLVTDADAAAAFVNGIVPSGLVEDTPIVTAISVVPDRKVVTKAELREMSDVELDKTMDKVRTGEITLEKS